MCSTLAINCEYTQCMVSTVYSEISQCYSCSIHHTYTCIELRNRHEGEDSARRAWICTGMSGHVSLMYPGNRLILKPKCMTGTNSMSKI